MTCWFIYPAGQLISLSNQMSDWPILLLSAIPNRQVVPGAAMIANQVVHTTNRRDDMKTLILSKATLRNTLMVAAFGLGLSGATAIAATADAAAPQPQSDGVAASITDTAITGSVKARLMDDSHLKQSDISVTTTNGLVILSCTVSSARAKSVAATQAKAVDGVKSIDNGLSVVAGSKAEAKDWHDGREDRVGGHR